MATNATTDLVVLDADSMDEDLDTGKDIAKTVATTAATTAVVAGALIAVHFLKPKVRALLDRKKNVDPMVVEGVVIETRETETV